ncbi:MAG TPA: response regulator [Salinisphaeraceae bacterium]|nr:response regulator [Salinisphaeraceae bacterium]
MSHFETRESTVIIVDDEPSIRDALEVLVTATGYRCMSFASGEAFLARPLPRVPHCLLLDLRLEDGRNGLEIQSELNARGATLPVLFLSAEDDVASAVSAMRAGALDFLQKPFDPELLLDRISRALQASVEGHDRRQTAAHDAALLASLTRREHEVLALLVDGHLNKEIARILGISVRTVETHRRHIMSKLQARTLADLVRVWLHIEFATEWATQPWQP